MHLRVFQKPENLVLNLNLNELNNVRSPGSQPHSPRFPCSAAVGGWPVVTVTVLDRPKASSSKSPYQTLSFLSHQKFPGPPKDKSMRICCCEGREDLSVLEQRVTEMCSRKTAWDRGGGGGGALSEKGGGGRLPEPL